MHETCLIIIHDPGMRPGLESNQGTFGLADECSTTELTLLVKFTSVYIHPFFNKRPVDSGESPIFARLGDGSLIWDPYFHP